jgi:hypothetical protein
MDQTTFRICPWCSTPIPSTSAACPKCHALVEGATITDIPGVTSVDPNATLGVPDEGMVPDVIDPLALIRAGNQPDPREAAAVAPPSDAVRLEMRKMELEAQIENAGSVVMNPSGDEAILVGRPSDEALAAEKAGLLDATGPAGETDLSELADMWEDPELERRVKLWQEQVPPDPKP